MSLVRRQPDPPQTAVPAHPGNEICALIVAQVLDLALEAGGVSMGLAAGQVAAQGRQQHDIVRCEGEVRRGAVIRRCAAPLQAQWEPLARNMRVPR